MFYVDALLFDLDGTLIEPSIDFQAMHQAVLSVIDHFGLSSADYASLYTLEAIARVRRKLEVSDPATGEAFDAAATQAVIAIEVEAAGHTQPYVGVPQMLEALKSRGFGVAIVTRNCRAAVEQVFSRTPLLCDVLLTRDDVTQVKPEPEHLLTALRALGTPGERALMCGDHPMDIIAGRRVGAGAVGVLRPGVEPSYFAEVSPDLILGNVCDLPRYLVDG